MVNPQSQINHPFLKWAGGKIRHINDIKCHFPKHPIGKYIEPFVGAGAMALNIDTTNDIIINDVNVDLGLVWTTIRDNVDELLYHSDLLFVPHNNTSESYYRLRTDFNTTATGTYRAALFIYLNKHCFNGLCRYNKKGEFNTPVGKYTSTYFPKIELINTSKIIKNWKIYTTDFRHIINQAENNDVVYCDPPYVPTSSTAYFTSYSPTGFSWKEHIDLTLEATKAKNRGSTVLISNHLTDKTKELYGDYGAEIIPIEGSHRISANSTGRKTTSELLAIFRPNPTDI